MLTKTLSGWTPIFPHLVLWALIVVLLGPAMMAGGFWWTDETRHAMGGVFILDLMRDLPFADPMGYAMRYFAQYPALALNWYLPGFYAVEAFFYAVFGVSEPVAHLAVIGFCLFGASFWFLWTRRTWGVWTALLATALLFSVPYWNFWARSVMLEAPAITMIILSVWCFERYLEEPDYSRAIAAGLIIAAALIVKHSVVFILPALLLYGLWNDRRAALWRWQAVPAYLLTLLALAILVIHALKFGDLALNSGDMSIAAGLSPGYFSPERWLVFPSALLSTWGWPLLILSVIGALLPSKRREIQLPLIYAWLLCWYVVATLGIGPGNAPRYTLYAFPALALLAARPVFLFAEVRGWRIAVLAILVIAVGVNTDRSLVQPVPYVDGYREAAEFVYGEQVRGSILFAGKHDGSFIFHLRRLNERREDVILRADKILVSMAVHKHFGMYSHVSNQDDIQALIDRYGVEIIVIEQPDIVGIKEFHMLRALLQEPVFQRISVQPVLTGGNAEAPKSIEIYRYLKYKPVENAMIIIPLPHMNREIKFRRSDVQ